eukprot:scaffold2418_cov58-Cyclotella_meneghiniana.AAC.19
MATVGSNYVQKIPIQKNPKIARVLSVLLRSRCFQWRMERCEYLSFFSITIHTYARRERISGLKGLPY